MENCSLYGSGAGPNFSNHSPCPVLILPGVVVESEALHCSECAAEDESHQAKVGCMEGCQVQCDSQALCPEAARAMQQVQSRFSQELQIIKS